MLRAIRLEGDRVRAGERQACQPGAPFWLDLSPDPEHPARLSQRFGSHPLALEDCAHLDQRGARGGCEDHRPASGTTWVAAPRG